VLFAIESKSYRLNLKTYNLLFFVAKASSHFDVHNAQEAVDGLPTSETCFWSAASVSSWWEVDLGVEVAISKIRITHTVSVFLIFLVIAVLLCMIHLY